MNQIQVANWEESTLLSKNFRLIEFIVSSTAFKQKLYAQYTARPDIEMNLELLCRKVLQPLRDYIEEPIIITSGFRCPMLNTLVGGAKNSLHMRGYAADIYIRKHKIDAIKFLRQMEFHELIIHPGYMHVSYKHDFNECKFLNMTSDRSLSNDTQNL